MGAYLGKNKDPTEKRFGRFQLCPGRKKKENSTVNQHNSVEKKSEWTDAHLQVPELLPDIRDQIIEEPPVPPPRKQRSKTQSLERQVVKKVEFLQNNADPNANINNYDGCVPIEEPIIVPKKEPVHICDGTHHHVTNIVNGKVIHDHHHIAPKRAKKENQASSSVRPKNTSTVSLPNYDELNKTFKIKNSKPKSTSMETTKKSSVISLPTESKIVLSATTTARLENYVNCCKSFGDLPPSHLLEKLQNAEYNSESDDSWDGEHNMIEVHRLPQKSPVEPRFKLSSPSLIRKQLLLKESHVIPSKEEIKKTSLHNITERRESIDDFFDSRAINPIPSKISELKENTSLGRRGSDSFFNESYKPQNKTELENNIFYSNALLQSESYTYEKPLSNKYEDNEFERENKTHWDDKSLSKNLSEDVTLKGEVIDKSKKKLPSANKLSEDTALNQEDGKKYSNDDISNKLDNYVKSDLFYSFNDGKDVSVNKSNDSGILNSDKSNDIVEDGKNVISKDKTENVKHSNLLKIIQENSVKVNQHNPDDEVEEEMKFKIPEPLRSALLDVDKKINKIDLSTKEID